jgi:hypothetical protein
LFKKSGFTIGRQEINQAEEYIDAIYKGNKLNCKPKIKAFVVGDSVSPSISTKKLKRIMEKFMPILISN